MDPFCAGDVGATVRALHFDKRADGVASASGFDFAGVHHAASPAPGRLSGRDRAAQHAVAATTGRPRAVGEMRKQKARPRA